MAHFNIDAIRKKTQGVVDGGAGTEATSQSAEESLQPLGSDTGAVSGEPTGSAGADTKQTDTDNDAAGSLPDKTQG